QMFRLGWVAVFPAEAPIQAGTTVAVLVHHFGFWSLNPARVIYVFDEPHRYGFAYGTLTTMLSAVKNGFRLSGQQKMRFRTIYWHFRNLKNGKRERLLR